MTQLDPRTLFLIRSLFVVSAIWNFAGAIPGLMDTAGMFEREFGRALTDPVMLAVYRGAWGTAFLYGFGFLMVALHPIKHSGIVLMGGAGKLLFALNLMVMHMNGWTSPFAIVVIVGDFVFIALFLIYFWKLKQSGHAII